ncbi:MAG: hypothetical protein FWH36_09410 [Lentimicrobiaceae bacterium]|nr:hypothetical protein [Lentimicrobiaceae bacterium]
MRKNYYLIQLLRMMYQKIPENADLEEFELLSVCYSNDSLQINDSVYHPRDFYSKIKQLIETHDNYMVVFSVDDELIFGDYLFVLSEVKRAVTSLRNEFAIKNYSTEYENCDIEYEKYKFKEKLEIIQQKIPIRLIERYEN